MKTYKFVIVGTIHASNHVEAEEIKSLIEQTTFIDRNQAKGWDHIFQVTETTEFINEIDETEEN